MNRWIIALLAVCIAASAVGCQQSSQPVDNPIEQLPAVSTVSVADPEAALDKIYEDIEMLGIEEASDKVLKDKFFIDPDTLEESYVRYSSGRYGLADVFILKPEAKQTAAVRELLEQIKLTRAREFVDYDIYNAHQIAQDALIFEQGGYLIMLMLEDTEAAREIIDQYIPKN